jgi:hypothetical protein
MRKTRKASKPMHAVSFTCEPEENDGNIAVVTVVFSTSLAPNPTWHRTAQKAWRADCKRMLYQIQDALADYYNCPVTAPDLTVAGALPSTMLPSTLPAFHLRDKLGKGKCADCGEPLRGGWLCDCNTSGDIGGLD